MTGREPLFVYAVVASGAPEPQGGGLDGAPLSLVRGDEVAALVSPLADEEPQLDRMAMMTYANVLEQMGRATTVLPMPFGTVMDDEAAVRAGLLTPHEDRLVEQLAAVSGKVEVKVRVTYLEQALMREVVSEDQDVARLRATLRGTSEAESHYGRLRLGELVAAAVDRKRQRDRAMLIATLSPLAADVRAGETKHEATVLNASFLVELERLEDFDAAVEQLGSEQAERMLVRSTGPLPAHSFVQLLSRA